GKKRRIKEGSTTMRRGFLPSDPSPRRTRGFCHQIPHHDRLDVSAIRSLTTDCTLTDFTGPATSDLLLPPGLTLRLLPGRNRHLHPLVAQDRPHCSCPSASDHRNGMQQTAAVSWW